MLELSRIRRTAYHDAQRMVRMSVVIASVVLVASCDKSTTSPGTSQEIVLGGLFSLTGNWATLGVTSKAAMETTSSIRRITRQPR